MNIPFSLALDNTTPHGILWNPWGATVPNSVDNTVLTGLSADLQERYSLLAPTRTCWITGITIMGDTDDAKVTLGIYDTERAAFDAIYPINAVVVKGGGVCDEVLGRGAGLFFPLNATRIPVIKFTPVGGSVIVTGNVSVHVLNDGEGTTLLGPTVFLQSVPNGTNLLEESTGLPLRSE